MDLLLAMGRVIGRVRAVNNDGSLTYRIQGGKAQLVSVTYNAAGDATETPRGEWVAVKSLVEGLAA